MIKTKTLYATHKEDISDQINDFLDVWVDKLISIQIIPHSRFEDVPACTEALIVYEIFSEKESNEHN